MWKLLSDWRCALCKSAYCVHCWGEHLPCKASALDSDTENEAFTEATVKETCYLSALDGCNGVTETSVVIALLLASVTVMNHGSKLLRILGKAVRNHWCVIFGLLLMGARFGTAMSANVTRNLMISPTYSSTVCHVRTGTEDLLTTDSGAGVCLCPEDYAPECKNQILASHLPPSLTTAKRSNHCERKEVHSVSTQGCTCYH